MAAGRLPQPGTKYGPCQDESCRHRDCAATRTMAAAICRFCNQTIGYDKLFYQEQDGSFVHALCLEEAIDLERAAWKETES